MNKTGESKCAKYESVKTIGYMNTYGIEKVRGGHYCSIEKEKIEKLLNKHGFEYIDGKLIGTENKYSKEIEELKKINKIEPEFNLQIKYNMKLQELEKK